ncbi:MAG: vitamin B12 dependent-methionine synthase activation domain-containing protein, partial [Dolichospermum sp.]
VAEALAEWTHARIRRELGFGDSEPDNIRDILAQRYQGSRYSFGYPACPNIQDQFQNHQNLTPGGFSRESIRLKPPPPAQQYHENTNNQCIDY